MFIFSFNGRKLTIFLFYYFNEESSFLKKKKKKSYKGQQKITKDQIAIYEIDTFFHS